MQAYLNFIDELILLVNMATDQQKQNASLDICHKLYPYYKQFAKEEDSILLADAIALCEQELAKSATDKTKLNEFIAKVEKLMPINPEADTWKESYAINAVSAVHELLMFTQRRDNQHVIDICSLLIDNVDFELAEANENITDDQIYDHPVMKTTMQQIKDMLI
ncbi:MAG: DUF416 family protein [Bacteroidales bacterium]|nr:DUF416 family protein [Bacteroidales bacterium]